MENRNHPVVAIVGRPNVGKSRLFNRLIGRYRALVDDQPGVTRDRHYGKVEWRGRSFMVIDTGGLIPGAEEPLNKKVWQQAFQAIAEADLILSIFDGETGVTPVDEELVGELRQLHKPILYAVNKIDSGSREKLIFDFSRLGCDPLYPVSAEHGRGTAELLDAIFEKLPPLQSAPLPMLTEAKPFRLSIIGRPNVGKSTLLNQLAGEERVVVHEEAGTTRDAIDLFVEREDKKYAFVDTAGIKRKKMTKTRLEKFSVVNALRAIEESQCVLYLLDALEGVTHHDLYMMNLIWERKKGLILLINKWDQMKSGTEKYIEELRPQLRYLQLAPVLCISAKSGENCDQIWSAVERMQEGLAQRFPTSLLNEWLEKIEEDHPIPQYKGKTVKLFYGTQIGENPPHIVIFSNAPEGIPESYRRYLAHQFSDRMDLEGVPIHFTFRPRR